MHCLFAAISGKWFPWEFVDGHTHAWGGGGGISCLAHLVCAALHGIGLWDLQS